MSFARKEMLAEALRLYPTWGDAYIAEREEAAKLRALLDRVIEKGVENWHTVPNEEPVLYAWLGMTWKEYAEWVQPHG